MQSIVSKSSLQDATCYRRVAGATQRYQTERPPVLLRIRGSLPSREALRFSAFTYQLRPETSWAESKSLLLASRPKRSRTSPVAGSLLSMAI